MATNAEWFNMLRGKNPSFASITSEATAATFTESGFGELMNTNPNIINKWFQLAVETVLQKINISRARDKFDMGGFGEYYETPFGGVIRRMAVHSIKPISPRYLDLNDCDSVDPWIIRRPKITERFFDYNFEFQSLVTLKEDEMKPIFHNAFGMDAFLAGIARGLENGWINQKYVAKKQAIGAALNDPKRLATQTVTLPSFDPQSSDDMKNFLYQLKTVIASMESVSQTGAFNALGFEDAQDISDFKLLIRPDVIPGLEIYTETGAYHLKGLAWPVDIVITDDFGDILHYKDGTQIFPAYSECFGDVVGYSETEGTKVAKGETAPIALNDPDITTVDTHANVKALLAHKGLIFTGTQNAYRVLSTPINILGLYTNTAASAPHNTIKYDSLYPNISFEVAAARSRSK